MGDRSVNGLFILAEMLKGRKLRVVEVCNNRYGKRQVYYVGETKVNKLAAVRIIEKGFVKSLGDGRFEINKAGREFYGKGHL